MASVLTRKAKDIWTARITGAGTEPKIISIGVTAPNSFVGTAAATDIGLFDESAENRLTGASSIVTTTTTNDTWQTTGTITATAGRAVVELGIFDSTTKPFSTTVSASAVVGSNSATALTVGASYTPANNTFIQIRTEVMQVTAGTGTTSLTVVRAQNGSAAISTIAAGDIVQVGNLPGSSNQVTGGNMAAHFDFAVVNLSTNDTFTPTIQVQFT